MNIVWHELKKIWNVKILIVIAMLCMVHYFMFMEHNVRHYPNGHPNTEMANFMIELTERYGKTITPEEMEAFLTETYAALVAEAEGYIQSNPIFAEVGVNSYLEFMEWRQLFFDLELPTEAEKEAHWILYTQEYDWVAHRIQALGDIQNQWDGVVHNLEMRLSQELLDWERQLFIDTKTADDLNAFAVQIRESLLVEADAHIARLPIFAENGITNYEDFQAYMRLSFHDFEASRTWWSVRRTLLGQQSDFVGSKLNLLEPFGYMAQYPPEIIQSWASNRLGMLDSRALNDRERERLMEVLENREYLNIMDLHAFENTMTYFNNFTTMLLLVTLVLLVPLLAVDRWRKIHSLQYTSSLGRQIMFRQLAAILLSSVMLTTILLAVFGMIYSITGVFMYWNHSLVSFHSAGWHIPFFEITFGQYMLIMVVMAYMLSLGTALIAFVISRFSRNLITAVVKAIPVYVVLFYLASSMFWSISAPLTLGSRIYFRIPVVGIEPIICAVLLIFTLAVALFISKCEKWLDIA